MDLGDKNLPSVGALLQSPLKGFLLSIMPPPQEMDQGLPYLWMCGATLLSLP